MIWTSDLRYSWIMTYALAFSQESLNRRNLISPRLLFKVFYLYELCINRLVIGL